MRRTSLVIDRGGRQLSPISKRSNGKSFSWQALASFWLSQLLSAYDMHKHEVHMNKYDKLFKIKVQLTVWDADVTEGRVCRRNSAPVVRGAVEG